jgi:hypothetical protein
MWLQHLELRPHHGYQNHEWLTFWTTIPEWIIITVGDE